MSEPSPALTGVVVHWRAEELLLRLLDAWPRAPRFELVVVDNGTSPGADGAALAAAVHAAGGRWIAPGRNLGFAGGVNAGVAVARGEIVLLLNPDVEPQRGALDRLLAGFDAWPAAAGLAPRLVGQVSSGGQVDARTLQFRWQLRRLPTAGTLILQTLLWPAGSGAAVEPAAGAVVEQPAAAALALRRQALEAVGGLDEGFYPAWFEDVDLARRLAAQGLTLRYWPAAVFRHHLGASVPKLGYGRFLWIYYRNLQRYLARHHGLAARAVAAVTLPLGLGLRLLLLPLRCPRRAASRGEAARALLAVLAGAVSGWRRPKALAREVSR